MLRNIEGGKPTFNNDRRVSTPNNTVPRLTIQYPTQADIDTYPAIEITSDLPWDPKDCEYENISDRNACGMETEI